MKPEMFPEQWSCYLDLLGVSEKVKRHDKALELLDSYRKFVNELVPPKDTLKNPLRDPFRLITSAVTRFFSDSIFIRCDAQPRLTDLDDCGKWFAFGMNFMTPLRKVLHWAWGNNLAVRGSIGLGRCCISERPPIVLGPGIVSNVEWEKVQEWPWVSVEPSSVRRMNVFEGGGATDFFVRHNVPTKEGDICTHALNPKWVCEQDHVCFFVREWRAAYSTGVPTKINKWSNVLRFFRRCDVDLTGLTLDERLLLG